MDVKNYMQQVGQQARAASRATARASTAAKNTALLAMAAAIRERRSELLAANAADVAEARGNGLDAAMIDRLTLTDKSVEAMAQGESLPGLMRGLWGRDKQRAPQIEQALKRLGLAQLETALDDLARVDRQAKGLERVGDAWDTLLRVGMTLAAPAAGAPGKRTR